MKPPASSHRVGQGDKTQATVREHFVRGELVAHIVRASTGPSFFHVTIAALLWYFADDNANPVVIAMLAIAASSCAVVRYVAARKLLGTAPRDIPGTRSWFALVTAHLAMLLLFCPLYILAFDPSNPGQQGFFTVAALIQGLGIAYSFGTGSLIMFLSANLTTLAVFFAHLMVGEENLFYIFGTVFGMVAFPIVGWRSGLALRERIGLQYTANNLITELRIARQEADEANAAKSNFLAHASHDLRQPLHAIGLFLESLPEEMEDQRTAYTIARVKQSQRQLSELFDTLLDVSVIDIGEVDVKLVDFPVGNLLSQIVQEFRPVAAEAGVNLRFAPARHWVRADPQLLGRMVRNLISNGLRFGDGGAVLVGCRQRDDTISVEVIDQGRGMSEEGTKRAFDEFERLENDTDSQPTPGFGLGLTIVARLAELQGLDVTVASQLGCGSAFRINGLQTVERPKRQDHEAPPEIATNTRQTRVLIIDDDPEVLDATRILLEKWNFAVDTQLQFEAQDVQRPDVLICDYELSDGMDGISVVGLARAAFGEDLRAIIISGTTHDALAQRTRAAGLPLLHKPVKPSQLRSALLSAQVGQDP